jgi:TonB family protein
MDILSTKAPQGLNEVVPPLRGQFFSFFILTILTGCASPKLTQEQLIIKNNYQEVIGNIRDESKIIPDTYPMYPDGLRGIINLIKKNTNYPPEAEKREIQGTVIVKFIVKKDGSVHNIEVIQSVSPLLDEEAIRIIELMDKWIPGYKDGKPVRVCYCFPFYFKLRPKF